MLRLSPNAQSLEPGTKILRADEYQSVIDAQEIIADAHRQADEIIEKANVEAERIRQQAHDDGVLDGKLQMSEKMVDTVGKTVEYFTSLEHAVVDIVMQCLRKILGLMDEEKLVIGVVRNSLSVARNQRNVTLRVCPGEAQVVREKLDTILADYPSIAFVEIESDSRLGKGGCILETEIGIVDASIEVQLEAIQKALSRRFDASRES